MKLNGPWSLQVCSIAAWRLYTNNVSPGFRNPNGYLFGKVPYFSSQVITIVFGATTTIHQPGQPWQQGSSGVDRINLSARPAQPGVPWVCAFGSHSPCPEKLDSKLGVNQTASSQDQVPQTTIQHGSWLPKFQWIQRDFCYRKP